MRTVQVTETAVSIWITEEAAPTKEQMLALVRQALADYQGTIISVSHDRKYLAEVCTKLYRLTADGLLPVDTASLY